MVEFSSSSGTSTAGALSSQSSVRHRRHTSASSLDNHYNISASLSRDHCPTSLSPVDNHSQRSPSPGTDKSNMTSPTRENPVIASASILETTKAPQSGFAFLSLPPEIRNMIYGFLFATVRDGTCWAADGNFEMKLMRGVRRECHLCSMGSLHTICIPTHHPGERDYYRAFALTQDYVHSNIYQTCRTIQGEACSVFLARARISFRCDFNSTPFAKAYMKRLLKSMGQPIGAHLAGLSITDYGHSGQKYDPTGRYSLTTFINKAEIKIGHLELRSCCYGGHQPGSLIRFFVDFLQSLDYRPRTIRWVHPDHRYQMTYQDDMDALNEAVDIWLEVTSKSKDRRDGYELPLLRDFLPQYFDQPST